VVQRPVLYFAFLHHDCTTFPEFLVKLSHDIGQDALIGVVGGTGTSSLACMRSASRPRD
jgi:hypothetical protein